MNKNNGEHSARSRSISPGLLNPFSALIDSDLKSGRMSARDFNIVGGSSPRNFSPPKQSILMGTPATGLQLGLNLHKINS